MHRILLKLSPTSETSSIYVGNGIFDSFETLLSRHCRKGKAVFVGDERLLSSLVQGLAARVRRRGWDASVTGVRAGEGAKSFRVLEGVYAHLLKVRADRPTPLIAVGGGTIGDMAGFAAATFQRGIPLVQVPTTLLAQVDSAIGGKTAVNHPLAKNAVGAFYQPAFTLADVACLRPLPARDFDAGLAEVVKCALVFDPPFARLLDSRWEALRSREPRELLNVVRRAVAWKAKVVSEDERDLAGRRELLNYGHTIGHALEAATSYGSFLHGEAVAWGMRAAGALARGRGWLSEPRESALMDSLLGRLPAPAWPARLRYPKVLEAMRRDKKARGNRNVFVLLRALAKPVRVADVSDEELLAALRGLIPSFR